MIWKQNGTAIVPEYTNKLTFQNHSETLLLVIFQQGNCICITCVILSVRCWFLHRLYHKILSVSYDCPNITIYATKHNDTAIGADIVPNVFGCVLSNRCQPTTRTAFLALLFKAKVHFLLKVFLATKMQSFLCVIGFVHVLVWFHQQVWVLCMYVWKASVPTSPTHPPWTNFYIPCHRNVIL